MWLHIPLRNLTRNRRRTLLSLVIIALGTAMIYAVLGYVDETFVQLRQGAVDQHGNLQIASPLLWEEKPEGFEYLIPPDALAQIEQILAQRPEVVAFTEQLILSGLASTGRKTKVLRATALEPGNAALDYNDLVVEGNGLDPADRGKVLIGRTLAEELNLKPGDFFRLTTTTVGGAYNVGTLQVAGIYSLNDFLAEGQLVFIPLSYGQTLLNTPGVAKVIVTLDELEVTDRVAAALQQELNGAGLDLEVRTWVQLADYYRQILGFFNTLFGFLTLSISVLVFFIVLQVLTMSFLERTREVGTIRAIGTKRRRVFSMFLTEGVLMGVLGGALGVAIGWGLGQGFNALGITWTPPGWLDPVPVQLHLSWDNAWLPFLVSAIATLLSALYPSVRSARVRIVEALRTA